MDLELYPKNNAPTIEGYGNGYINISGNKISNTILLLPDKYINIPIFLKMFAYLFHNPGLLKTHIKLNQVRILINLY